MGLWHQAELLWRSVPSGGIDMVIATWFFQKRSHLVAPLRDRLVSLWYGRCRKPRSVVALRCSGPFERGNVARKLSDQIRVRHRTSDVEPLAVRGAQPADKPPRGDVFDPFDHGRERKALCAMSPMAGTIVLLGTH